MPQVLTFWQLLEDEARILSMIEGIEPIICFPAGWLDDPNQVCPVPLISFLSEGGASGFRICPASLVQLVEVEEHDFSGGPRWGTTIRRSPLIDYRRGQLRGRLLALSNLAAHLERLTSDKANLVRKPDAFLAWCKKVFTIVRKETPGWYKFKSYRLTKAAAEASLSGTIELVDY